MGSVFHSDHSNESHVFCLAQWLCRDDCHHILRSAILEMNLVIFDTFSNEVHLYVNVFSSSIALAVLCKCNCSLTVGFDAYFVRPRSLRSC